MSRRVPIEEQTQCFATQDILGIIDHEREGDEEEMRMTEVMEFLQEMFTHKEATEPEDQPAQAHDSKRVGGLRGKKQRAVEIWVDLTRGFARVCSNQGTEKQQKDTDLLQGIT